MFSFNLCCSPVLYSIILFLPHPLPRCLLSSLSVHFPYGNRFPMRFSGPPLTRRQVCRPRARGRGRSVISPVLSLTWNIWHGDTSKERDFCVCVYVYRNMWVQRCEVLQTGGGKRTTEKLFFFPLWALPESVQLPQRGGKRLAWASIPRSNRTGFCQCSMWKYGYFLLPEIITKTEKKQWNLNPCYELRGKNVIVCSLVALLSAVDVVFMTQCVYMQGLYFFRFRWELHPAF